ncbi:hypothetical protein H4R33_004939 [Dimargaris cristalligena]|nr:hypothetical protein H4R33_004939 [Dimargaris cristalligena]
MWVFGYGSLIWKVDFPIETSRPGYIKGFVRRFWQGSHDHRGTEENPGRVVTLIPTEELAQFEDNHMETIAWGMAYKVQESKVAEVVKHLDHREKNGYSVHHVHVYHPDSETPVVEDAVVYIGTPDNEAFLGPASLDAISHQIVKSVAISPDAFDSHLFALEKRVLEIKAEQAKQASTPVPLLEKTLTDMTEATEPNPALDEVKKPDNVDQDDDEKEAEDAKGKFEPLQRVKITEHSKEDLLVLLENFSPIQQERYEAYRRSALNKSVVKRLISNILNQTASSELAFVVAGFGKVFIGEIVEKARDIQEQWGDEGALSPAHLREAYRRYQNETGLVPSTIYRKRKFN